MIAYLDTSAIIPLLIREPSSEQCELLWDAADDVATHQIAYVECAAALAAARRALRITSTTHVGALEALERYWSEMLILPVDDALIVNAAALAASQALRGYDAIHCAGAVQVADIDMVAAAGDGQLLAAWQDLGIATVDVTR